MRLTFSRPKLIALGAVEIGLFMSIFDGNVVMVALPTIQRELGIDVGAAKWVTMAYLFAAALSLLTAGRLADLLGARRVLIAGYTVFLVAAGLSAAAPSFGWLVGFRVLQALGDAALATSGLAIVKAAFTSAERPRALGISGLVIGLGAILGPLLGGLLVDSLGWRAIFLVNGSIGLVGLGLALRLALPQPVVVRGWWRSLDVPGALTAAVGLAGLLITFERSSGALAGSRALVGLAVGLSALGLFVLIERRAPQPLLNLALFRNGPFVLGCLALSLSYVVGMAGSFLLPYYLQVALGYPAAQAGLALAPLAIVITLLGPVAGVLAGKLSARVLASLALGLTGLALLWLARLGLNEPYWSILPGLLLIGAGSALFYPSNDDAILGSVREQEAGQACGVYQTMRPLGQLIGISLAAGLLDRSLETVNATDKLDALGQLTIGPPLLEAFVAGQSQAFQVAALAAGIGVAISVLRGGRAPAARDER